MAIDESFKTLYAAATRGPLALSPYTLDQVLRDPARVMAAANMGVVRAQMIDLMRDWLTKNHYLSKATDIGTMNELTRELMNMARAQQAAQRAAQGGPR